MNNFFNNLKFNRLSYLLEVIELRDFKSKINAYNKIRKMNITEDMGLLILDKIDYIHEENYSDINITISLLSLLFKEYYPSYSEKLFNIFPKLPLDSKKELLNILSFNDNDEVIILYRRIIERFYKELDNIPIGNLSVNKGNYSLLFPELYKTLKHNIDKNNVIILLNDFVNAGVVPIDDIKKHKKVIQSNILNIFKEGLKYKYKDETFMSDKEYINLRIFLESAINLEYYVSNKDTKAYLEKFLKKKDNQLKLFILDNYIRKNKSISKTNFNLIAKDNLSRYPLYSFLVFNKLEKLMPKKYNNNASLSESDLAINFSIFNSYNLNPYDFELLEEKIVNGYKYYIYKFKTKYNYNEEVIDPATDYLLKNLNIDEKLEQSGETTYIGISGGFNKDSDPSLVEKPLKELKVAKYNDNYEKIVNNLLSSEKKKEVEKVKEEEKKLAKEKKAKLKKQKEKIKEEKKEINKEIENVAKELDKIKDNLDEAREAIKKQEEKKLKENIEVKKDYFDKKEEKEEVEEVVKHPILRMIFSFNTLLMLISFAVFFFVAVLYLYLNNVDLFNIMKDRKNYKYSDTFKEYKLKDAEKFKETSVTDVFHQGESDYYVLFFNKKDKSSYYPFVDKFVNNGYTFYYVNIGKDKSTVFEHNGTVFTVTTDTLFRVTDGDYNFFIVEKSNILREFKLYMKDIEAKEEAADINELKEAKASKAIEEIVNKTISEATES